MGVKSLSLTNKTEKAFVNDKDLTPVGDNGIRLRKQSISALFEPLPSFVVVFFLLTDAI